MTKKFLAMLITVVSLVTLTVTDADARRMGGSKSFGKQSSNVTRQQTPAQPAAGTNQTQNAAPAAAPGAAAAKPASPWKGMLGGALLGLGLGALLSSLGLGAGLANFISIVLMVGIGIVAVMLLMRWFRKKDQPQAAFNNGYASPTEFSATPEIGSRLSSAGSSGRGVDTNQGTWEIPAGFDVAQFERTAQTYFIRLQAAWDKADLNDIREFTTPEMFAEIKMQIQERGDSINVTDVLTVNVKLLGIETQSAIYLASVKFVGTMKEDVGGPTISFEEVWNLSKPVAGEGGWLLGGIQQVE